MIGALADAGARSASRAGRAAERAFAFVERALVVRAEAARARVCATSKDGVVKGPGFLDDHAFVADAALDLYEATGDPRWVALARALADAMLAHFWDAKDDGFYFTPDDGES